MARTAKPKPGTEQRVAEGIYKRTGGDGQVYYVVRVYNPDKGPKGGKDNFNASSLDEARAIKRREEAKKKLHERSRGIETVAQWNERWLKIHKVGSNGRERKASTMAGYREALTGFVHDFGDRPIGSLDKSEAQLWVNGGPAGPDLEKTAAKWAGSKHEAGVVIVKSHRSVAQVCRTFYNDAIKSGIVQVNPFDGIAKTYGGRGARSESGSFLTPGELERLVEIAGEVHGSHGIVVIGPMIQFAAYTGVRPGELYALYPEDIDLEAEDVHVRRAYNGKTGTLDTPKNHKSRVVPLLPEARAALDVLTQGRGMGMLPPGEPIFKTAHGRALTQRNLHYYWDKVRGAFEVSLPASHWLKDRIRRHGKAGNLDFYELRHFFGSRLAELGASPYDIADAMGHQDGGKLAMQVYIKTRSTDARDRIRALAKVHSAA